MSHVLHELNHINSFTNAQYHVNRQTEGKNGCDGRERLPRRCLRHGTRVKAMPSTRQMPLSGPGTKSSVMANPPLNRRGSSRFRRSFHQLDTSPAGVLTALQGRHLEKEEPPEGSMAAKFKIIQKEIQDAVERADQKLLEYDIFEQEKAEQHQIELTENSEAENTLTLSAEDVDNMIPAASKRAMYSVAESHEDAMGKLLRMYHDLDPASMGEPMDAAPMDHFMDDFKSAQDLVNDVQAHREKVLQRVEAAQQSLVGYQEKLKEAELKELEELGMYVEPEIAPPMIQAATSGGGDAAPNRDASKVAAFKDHIRLLEGRVNDLQAEVSEEQEKYQEMEEIKDELISALKLQIERSHDQMEGVIHSTSHDLADSAAAVEDTRLHIAYLTVQLRNARELADSRNFDVDKWVPREDLEAAVKNVNSLKMQAKKLTDRVKSEQKNTDEAHSYAKKCLSAKEKADLSHAEWEMQLRDTLKVRDQDLVNLNFETRLLHHRADKLVREVEETKDRLEREKKEAVQQAMQAMEQQREAFNGILRTRDATIKEHKSQNQSLTDSLTAMTSKHKAYFESVKKAEEDRLARQVEGEMMTDPVKGGFGGLDEREKDKFLETSTQTGTVQGILWRVLRRKFAIEAIGSLDRTSKKLDALDQSLLALEAKMRSKWSESEGLIKNLAQTIADAFSAIPENMKQLQDILSTLEEYSKREETALQQRTQLKDAVADAMEKMRSGMEDVLDIGVQQDIEKERADLADDDDDDVAVFEELNQKLLTVKAELSEFQSGGVEIESHLMNLSSEISGLLAGDILQSVVSIRTELTHEKQISQRYDFTHHTKTLTAITAGDFADTMPQSAGGIILSNPHLEESKALGDIIKVWNQQKTDWVKERFKLIQESNAYRKELQNTNFEILKGKDYSSRPGTNAGSTSAQGSRPGTTAAEESSKGQRGFNAVDAAKFEFAVYRSSTGNLEMEMDALTQAITNLWRTENAFDFVDISVDTGVILPPLWGKCMKLVQAASLAFHLAKTSTGGRRPETAETSANTDDNTDSRPQTAGIQIEAFDDEQRELEEKPVAPGGQMAAEDKDELEKKAQSAREDKERRKQAALDKKKREEHAERERKERRKQEKEKKTNRSRLGTAQSHTSSGTVDSESTNSKDGLVKILHTNDSAMRKSVHELRDILARPVSNPAALPVAHACDRIDTNRATCPGCLAAAADAVHAALVKDAPAYRIVDSTTALADDAREKERARDHGGDLADGSEDIALPSRDPSEEQTREAQVMPDAADVTGTADTTDTTTVQMHVYDVSGLVARSHQREVADSQDAEGAGEATPPPTEMCVHGHRHTVAEILSVHKQRVAAQDIGRVTSGAHVLATPHMAATTAAESDAARLLQCVVRRRYGQKGPDFLGSVLKSQSILRTELQTLTAQLVLHVGGLEMAQGQVEILQSQLVTNFCVQNLFGADF